MSQASISFASNGALNTSSSCFVNALLNYVAPAHYAAVPVDLTTAGLPVPRGNSYSTYFYSLGQSYTTQSALWTQVVNASTIQAGDVIAWASPSTLTDDTGTVAVATGPAAMVGAMSAMSATGVPMGTLLQYSVPVIGVVSSAGVTSSSITLLVDPSSYYAMGVQVQPAASPAYVTVGAGRMLGGAGVAGATPPLHSASLCDALGQQSPMIVATTVPADPASQWAQLYAFRGDTGFPAREFSVPLPGQGIPVGVVCNDVVPGGTAEALLFPSAANAPAGTLPDTTQGYLSLVSLAAGAQMWAVPAPFLGPASAGLCDINGDGFNDVVVAAASNASPEAAELVYAYLWEPAVPGVVTSGGSLPGAPSFTVNVSASLPAGAYGGLSIDCAPINASSPTQGALIVAPASAAPLGATSQSLQVWMVAAAPQAPTASLAHSFTLPASANGWRVSGVGITYVQGWLLAASVPDIAFGNAVTAGAAFWLFDTAAPAAPPLSLPVPADISPMPGLPLLLNGGSLYAPPVGDGQFSFNGSQPAYILGASAMPGAPSSAPLQFQGVWSVALQAGGPPGSIPLAPLTPVLAPTAASVLAGGLQPASAWATIAANTPALQPPGSGTAAAYMRPDATWCTYGSKCGSAPASPAAPGTAIRPPRNQYATPLTFNFAYSQAQRTSPPLAPTTMPFTQWSSAPYANWYLASVQTASEYYGVSAQPFNAPAMPGVAGASGAAYARERVITNALSYAQQPINTVLGYV